MTELKITNLEKDEYAEKPEEVLNEKDLNELKTIEKNVKAPDKAKTFRKPWEKEVFSMEAWNPKTNLGKRVKDGKIKKIDEILDKGEKILEPEIVDALLNLKTDLILIGQAKGKFGGGKRRAWKQTQRKTEEGNVLKFSAMSVVGDENGHVGIGKGNSVETLPARDKSKINAKLNIFKITRKCFAFDCECSEPHTIPFKVSGKSGSVEITLIPAPQGTGLVVTNELKKVLRLVGIKDIYSKTSGQTRTTVNLVKACIDALKKTNRNKK
ncbi:MAG: 30S ribosomal protein S5 [Nanoarchaeota archaeon]|nr:30S ribosomal protein S5 [Nanoarchaeota archaeon]